MSSSLQVFKYTEGHAIRTVIVDGEAWFVVKDVCDVLGLTDVSMTVSRLDEDEKLVQKLFVSGQKRDVITISEPGLYKLIMRSTKPEAKQFTRWVTHEVLPSIHKSGMYLTEGAADAYMNNPELFKALVKRCSTLEAKVKEMEATLNERYSLSVLGETVLALSGAISFKDGASFLSQHGVPIGQNRLFRHCRERKLLCARKGRQWNKPTQKALDAGLFNVEISGGFNAITMITPRGMKYLTDELVSEQYPLLALIGVAD